MPGSQPDAGCRSRTRVVNVRLKGHCVLLSAVQDGSRGLCASAAQFMMRTRGGEPVFAFELWHERLLPAAAVAARTSGG